MEEYKIEINAEYRIKVKDKKEINKKAIEYLQKNKLIKSERLEEIHFKINAKTFKNIIKAHGEWYNEIRLDFNKKGMNIKTVDPAHVAMICEKIPKKVFDSYQLLADKDISLGIDYDRLKTILRSVKVKDVLSFDSRLSDYKIDIKINNFKHTTGLIDTAGMPDPKIPKLKLDAFFSIKSKLLYDFAKQAEKVSDHIKIEISKKDLVLSANDDKDNVIVSIDKKQLSKHKSDKKYISLFSVDYFLGMINLIRVYNKELSVRMGTDNPIEIKGDELTELYVLIAPRIESE